MTFRTTVASSLAAALVLAGCGGDDAGGAGDTDDGETTQVEDADAAEDTSDDPSVTDEAEAEAAPVEDAEQAVFDPAQTISLKDVEATSMGTTEVPFEGLPEAFAFDMPAAVFPITWSMPEDGWVTRWRQAGTIQFQVPGGDVDNLTAFVEDQAATHGWEAAGDGRWETVLPLSEGPEDLPNAELEGWVADTTIRVWFNETQDPIWMNLEVTTDTRFTG